MTTAKNTAAKLTALGTTENGIPMLEAIEMDMVLSVTSNSNRKNYEDTTGLTGYSTGLTTREYAERLDAIQQKPLNEFLADSYAWSEASVPQDAEDSEVLEIQLACIEEDADTENFVWFYNEEFKSIVYRF